jgi:glycosyltransferase 2 family protein
MKPLSTGIRVSITIGLFAVLLSRLDGGRIADILSHGSPILFAAAVVALAATNFVVALRWRLVLAGRSQIERSALLKILFTGWFFNQVLPTGIGGDAVRAWRCKLSGMNLATATTSILIDRASGYIVLVVIYATGLPALLAMLRDPRQQHLLVLVLVLGAAVCGLAALFLSDRLPQVLRRLRPVAPLANLSIEARRVLLEPRRAAPIFGLTMIATGLTVLAVQLVGRSVNIDLTFGQWLLIVPPVTLFQLLPLSLGGWGVREAAVVVILAAFGIPGETALAASLCVGLAQIVVGLPGGLIWLNNWDLPTREPGWRPLALPEARGQAPSPS